MPELPEMETYRSLLLYRVTGKTITGCDVTRPKSINLSPESFYAAVVGRQIVHIDRRAKQLLFVLEDGHVLLLHLMLGGVLFWGTPEQKPDRTVQVALSFGLETLHFIGLRLGYLHYWTKDELTRELMGLGPEPLEPSFTEKAFADIASQKRGSLKASLVDQHFISGIGNCYSDEICFAAGLLPARKIERLDDSEAGRLYRAIQSILREATGYGGYMDMPLYIGDNLTGGFDAKCRVYDREGLPCVRCGNPIVRKDVGSRKSFCCLNCQH
ncbi:Fpg/Nei family DNA glycosylase [Paenibacillus contaminans]|uniref:Formamidopyrimidine-DNA glycosylase n=1 Tax=Paenibacillus contaminans TaxID=450362 RepID=A0A329MLA2_9BACL|nr:DNA-formamidopyrimidine glycosylase family protein [Paenibacillus contaminans]RAV20585.1 endonuclease VIII [Paenibacillus contaminans]